MRSSRAPSWSPATVSFRYWPAHSARPGSTASLEGEQRASSTPPVDVITTTMTTCGWRSSTSTWRTIVVSSGGAETSASRCVRSASASVVARSARSTWLSTTGEVQLELAGARARADRARGRRRAGSRPRSAPARRTCAGASGGPAPRAPRARSAPSRTRRRARPARRASSTRPGAGGDVLLDDAGEDQLLPLG